MAQKFCYNSYVARENQNPYLRRNEPVETAKGRRGERQDIKLSRTQGKIRHDLQTAETIRAEFLWEKKNAHRKRLFAYRENGKEEKEKTRIDK